MEPPAPRSQAPDWIALPVPGLAGVAAHAHRDGHDWAALAIPGLDRVRVLALAGGAILVLVPADARHATLEA